MAILDNLISYWKLDEESGERADSHGTNDLSDGNTVLFGAGKVGNGASYVLGNSEHLYHADNADLSFVDDDFAFAGWVYLDVKNADLGIIGKYEAGTDDREYLLYYDTGDDVFRWRVCNDPTSGLPSVDADELGAVSVSTWYFIVVWHDKTANVIGIQVNNGTADTAAAASGCNDNTSTFCIGSNNDVVDNPFDGIIDEVGLWGKVLTADEKTELYNGGNGLTYPFFIPTATTIF